LRFRRAHPRGGVERSFVGLAGASAHACRRGATPRAGMGVFWASQADNFPLAHGCRTQAGWVGPSSGAAHRVADVRRWAGELVTRVLRVGPAAPSSAGEIRRALLASRANRPRAFHRARRLRSRPSAVLGPVLFPPWSRQRPFRIAGHWQAVPRRVLAPHRGAFDKSPRGFPFLRGPGSRFMGFIGHFCLPPSCPTPGPHVRPREPFRRDPRSPADTGPPHVALLDSSA